MEITLNQDQTNKLESELTDQFKDEIINLIKSGIQQATNNSRPYLTRKEMAEFLGVAPSTLTYWVSLGMPVAEINGRKLYGKETVKQWLKSKEKTVSSKTTNKKETV